MMNKVKNEAIYFKIIAQIIVVVQQHVMRDENPVEPDEMCMNLNVCDQGMTVFEIIPLG